MPCPDGCGGARKAKVQGASAVTPSRWVLVMPDSSKTYFQSEAQARSENKARGSKGIVRPSA